MLSKIVELLRRITFLILRFWGGISLLTISFTVVVGYQRAVSQLVESTIAAVVQFTVLLFGYFVLLWSYYRTNFTRPSLIPDNFHLTEHEFEVLSSQQGFHFKAYTSYLADLKGLPRSLAVCAKCRIFVPERAHHCRICRRCILRMDHHCPFFGNCIHFGNEKYFILTLVYAFASCLFVFTTMVLISGIPPHSDPRVGELSRIDQYLLHGIFSFSTACCAAVGAFLSYCLWHVLRNTTPVEVYIAFQHNESRTSPYDKGISENWREIFGPVILAWFLPLYSTIGDGVNFTMRGDLLSSRKIPE